MTEKISIEVESKRVSGQYVVSDGMVTVTASDGRTTKGVIERGQSIAANSANVPELLILSPAIDLLAPSIEHSNAVGAALFPGVQHRLSSGLHPLRSNGVVL